MCSGVRDGRLKRDQCCCTRGKAWTDLIMPCQECPSPDTGLYLKHINCTLLVDLVIILLRKYHLF